MGCVNSGFRTSSLKSSGCGELARFGFAQTRGYPSLQQASCSEAAAKGLRFGILVSMAVALNPKILHRQFSVGCFWRFNVPRFGAGDSLARAGEFGLEVHEAQKFQVFRV